MSEYLAIDLDRYRLAGVRARVVNQRLRIEEHFQLDWPADLDYWADPVAAGEWLKAELSRRSVSGEKIVVSLPRNEVVIRQIDVPDVPDAELPNLVRLQAETKSATSLSDTVLDFLPLPSSQPSSGRHVLIITIARSRLDRLAELADAAGLQLESVGVSAIATTELVARAEARQGSDRDEAALVVTPTHNRVEVAFVREDRLLFTHSAQLSGDDAVAKDAAAIAEVRRAMGAVSRSASELRASRVWVVGTATETGALRNRLEEYLDCAVTALEPLADPAVTYRPKNEPSEQAQLAGPIGLLLALANPTVETVDLLRPRKPKVEPDRRRLKLALAVGGTAVVIALAFGNTIWKTRTIEKEIESVQNQIARADQSIQQAGGTLTTAGLIEEWDRRDVDFLYQLTELNDVLPGTDRVYLRNLQFAPLQGDAIARIQADGRARTRDDVQKLYQRLVEREYRVKPQQIVNQNEDKDYPIEFKLDVAITAATNSRVTPPPDVAETSNVGAVTSITTDKAEEMTNDVTDTVAKAGER